MNLEDISTLDLARELAHRREVRIININKDESYKIQAAKHDDSKLRYVRGDGPCHVIEINLEKEH